MLEPGLKYSTTNLLRAGIILIGLKLSGADLASNASVAVPAVAVSITLGLITGTVLSRMAGLPHKMGSLIAAGSSICGVTAITALAPVIKADERDVAFAIATVVCFGTTAMLLYPYLAHAAFNNSQAIGLFLGCAIHDTSQVIGSALTYGQVYGDDDVLKAAAITKLTRNLALAGVIPILAWHNSTLTGNANDAAKLSTSSIVKFFPPFVAGFIAMAGLRTIGDYQLVNGDLALWMFESGTWKYGLYNTADLIGSSCLLGTAMGAVGLSTNAKSLRGVGFTPFIVGGSTAAIVGAAGFVMAKVLVG